MKIRLGSVSLERIVRCWCAHALKIDCDSIKSVEFYTDFDVEFVEARAANVGCVYEVPDDVFLKEADSGQADQADA
jgi:hypothetical protein